MTNNPTIDGVSREYTCKGKGGRYKILGLATGAGLSRGEDRLVYRDTATDRLFLRTEADFSERMELLRDVAAPVVERQEPVDVVPSDNAQQAITLMDFALSFALCNMDHAGTRRDIKKAQGHLAALKAHADELQSTIDRQAAEIAELKSATGEPVAYVLTRDGEVCYEADDGIVISNTPGDETNLYKWKPVYFGLSLPTNVLDDHSAFELNFSDKLMGNRYGERFVRDSYGIYRDKTVRTLWMGWNARLDATAALNASRPGHNPAPADHGTHPDNDGLEDYREVKE